MHWKENNVIAHVMPYIDIITSSLVMEVLVHSGEVNSSVLSQKKNDVLKVQRFRHGHDEARNSPSSKLRCG